MIEKTKMGGLRWVVGNCFVFLANWDKKAITFLFGIFSLFFRIKGCCGNEWRRKCKNFMG